MQKLDCKEEEEEEKEEADKISNPTSNTNKISIKYWKRAMQKLDCKEEEVEEGGVFDVSVEGILHDIRTYWPLNLVIFWKKIKIISKNLTFMRSAKGNL